MAPAISESKKSVGWLVYESWLFNFSKCDVHIGKHCLNPQKNNYYIHFNDALSWRQSVETSIFGFYIELNKCLYTQNRTKYCNAIVNILADQLI